MAQRDFFAVREDQLAVPRFLFAETDVRVFEHCSKPDAELVELKSAEEIADAFGLGADPDGNGLHAMLALWSPTVVPKLEIRRIDFDPKRVSGARFRHEPASGSLMHLYFGGLTGRTITKSHFGHHSQASARSWRLEAGANWPELSVLSRRIKYQIGSLGVWISIGLFAYPVASGTREHVEVAMKPNAAWHQAHPMPGRATLQQRITWHLGHAQACGCRAIPATVLAEIRKRGIKPPPRKCAEL